MHDKHFGSLVTVLRVVAARRLPRRADIEAVGNTDMHVLVGVLGHAGADNGKVFLAITAGGIGVDKSVDTGHQA